MARLTILTASRCLLGPEVREQLFENVAALLHDIDEGINVSWWLVGDRECSQSPPPVTISSCCPADCNFLPERTLTCDVEARCRAQGPARNLWTRVSRVRFRDIPNPRADSFIAESTTVVSAAFVTMTCSRLSWRLSTRTVGLRDLGNSRMCCGPYHYWFAVAFL